MKKEETTNKEGLILTCILIFLACLSLIIGIIFIGLLKNSWIQAHFIICSIVYSLVVISLCIMGICFAYTKKKSISKLMLSIFVLLLFAVSVGLILQKTGFFEVIQDAESLQAYLERAGVWMPILYVILQFLQVVLLPIPSIVSTVAGIALFGPFQTTLYSFIGIMAGSLLAFYIGRKWGKKILLVRPILKARVALAFSCLCFSSITTFSLS